MAGIAAIIGNLLNNNDGAHIIERMMAVMRHRGSSFSASCTLPYGILGYTQSLTDNTCQPTSHAIQKEHVSIAYDGECYNICEQMDILKKKGHTFCSDCEIEVLLAMYIEYGERFIERLRGNFAFVLYDAHREIFLCARDRLGIKPLLFSKQGNCLVIASELRAMLASGMIAREINKNALYNLLCNGSVPQPYTMLDAVQHLMPGHLLKWHKENISITPYWYMQCNRYNLVNKSYAHIMEEGENLLTDILRMQMAGNAPLGAFLSGGIDSSLLVAFMQRIKGDLQTFSIGFESDLNTTSENEVSDAEQVAHYLGCRHETFIIAQDEIAGLLPRIASDLDHPTVDGVNSWLICRAASRSVKVGISGTGGDELFAGYPWFQTMYNNYYRQPLWRRCYQRFFATQKFVEQYRWQYIIYPPQQVAQLMSTEDVTSIWPDDPLPQALPLNRVTGLVLSGYTRNQLLYDMDTASQAHSLSVRVPLLDTKLLEFALSLPDNAKLCQADPKAPAGSYAHSGVKRLLLDLGKDMLPPGFDRRGKRGFIMPFDAWLRGELHQMATDVLDPMVVKKRDFFNAKQVQKIWRDFNDNKAYWPQIWLLIMLELWAQSVLDEHYVS